MLQLATSPFRCCTRHCRKDACNVNGIDAMTLKFHDPGIENGFLRSRRRELTQNGVAIAVAVMVTSGVVIASVWSNQSHYFDGDVLKMERVKTGLLSFQICMSGLSIAWLNMPVSVISDYARETGIAVLVIIGLHVAVAIDTWYLNKLLGTELITKEVLSDSKVLLVLDGAITITHLTLPIRWKALFPMEIAAVSLYTACICVGSPEAGTAPVNWAFLLCLVFFSALGKRTIEYYERRNFCKLLHEKQLRFQTEFQLEKIGKMTVPNVVERDPMEVSTNSSARIFDTAVAAPSELTGQMAEIAAVGRTEQWLVDPAELRVLRHCILGSGGFGIVLGGFLCEAPVAIKLSKRLDPFSSGKGIIDISNEVRILRRLRHPNIVLFHGAYVDAEKWNIALVLEKVSGTLLSQYVHPHSCPDGKTCFEGVAINQQSQGALASGICQALLYLHTRKPSIVHGDLKPGNIVVECCSNVLRPKLLDFGLSRILGNGAKVLGRTQGWAAPEVLLHPDDPASVSADMFSFGCILYFLSTGKKPREGQTHRKTLKAAKRAEPLQLCWSLNCEFMQECRPFVNDCVQHQCALRPSIQDACERMLRRGRDAVEESRGEPLTTDVLNYVRQQSMQRQRTRGQHLGLQPKLPKLDNLVAVEIGQHAVKHIGRQDPHEGMNLAPEVQRTSEALPHTSPTGLPPEAPTDIQSVLLGTLVLDCAISDNVPVHACSVHTLTPANMPNSLFFSPPACLANWMSDDNVLSVLKLMQRFVNEHDHGIRHKSRLARIVLRSAFRTYEGMECPVAAYAECSSCPEESMDKNTTLSEDDVLVRVTLTIVSSAATHMRPSRQRSVSTSSLTAIEEGPDKNVVLF